ncbi:MAG TPA: pitrilysin family protein [Arenimonas sp.]|uniref:M16 family metallopeptidase n=1 Tax=Arenimonas sp. TaxID=1872635 RepID=UPI002B7AF029|nr:pitrilysin family protein [Arenimonas sp.]HMB56795.1 pitrilysin family protein [Arenimonas sp.]
MKTAFSRFVFAAALVALPLFANAQGIALPAYEQVTLANGTQLLLMEKHDVPLIALNARLRGGALADANGKEGSAALLAALMQKGAGKRDAKTFAETVDGAGGRLDIASDVESLQLNAEFMSRDAQLMIDLSADALLRPTLAPAEFAKVKDHAIQSIAAAKDSDPRQLLRIYGNAWLFRGTPYGRPRDGDETSLATVTLDDLHAYRNQLGGDRLIVAVVGDFHIADMKKALTAAFGGWEKAKGTLPTVAAKKPEQGRRVLLVDKPGATQSYFWLGNVGVDRRDPELAAQTLANTVFGGRFTSMINTELRIKSGLSYGAGSSLSRFDAPGAAAITSFTRTEDTGKALDLALATLDRLHKDGIAADMRESAKNYVLGQFPPTLETAPALAGKIAELAFYGLDRKDVDGFADRIKAATPEQFTKAIAVYPETADLAIVIIGDAGKLRETAKKYGPVTELKITDPHFVP